VTYFLHLPHCFDTSTSTVGFREKFQKKIASDLDVNGTLWKRMAAFEWLRLKKFGHLFLQRKRLRCDQLITTDFCAT
jgi:hypothetical protein